MAQWRNGYSVKLAINRSWIQMLLRAMLCNNLGQVVHTCVPVTKQYNLVPAKGWRCSAAGKVTAGLAVMATYRLVDDLWSPAGWLPVHQDQLQARHSVSSMGKLLPLPLRLRNRFEVGLVIKRSRVQLLGGAQLHDNSGQVVHTLLSLSPSSENNG